LPATAARNIFFAKTENASFPAPAVGCELHGRWLQTSICTQLRLCFAPASTLVPSWFACTYRHIQAHLTRLLLCKGFLVFSPYVRMYVRMYVCMYVC